MVGSKTKKVRALALSFPILSQFYVIKKALFKVVTLSRNLDNSPPPNAIDQSEEMCSNVCLKQVNIVAGS